MKNLTLGQLEVLRLHVQNEILSKKWNLPVNKKILYMYILQVHITNIINKFFSCGSCAFAQMGLLRI
jgi:hypothetical protein